MHRTPIPTQSPPPKTLFMGSFPPRECGIATFTRDVVDSFDRAFGTYSDVVAIDEPGGEERVYSPRVVARLRQDVRDSYRQVAAAINAHPSDLLNVQHEYGLYGGDDGAWFLDVLALVRKPVVVSLHTVLPEPSDAHRALVRRLCELSASVVVLSQTGKDLLISTYGIDADKLHVIHHGVPDVPFRSPDEAKARLGLANRPIVSTFGLISRGKGLEYGIDAMRSVVARHPNALYLILGQTHPSVRRKEGESYRQALQGRVSDQGLENNVRLVDKYLDFEELIAYLAATDIYLTPYLNRDQIVSGTLAYAIGLGKAIVSTPYLYAQELLADGRGVLAPFRDAEAVARALTALLDDPLMRRAVEHRAYRFGRQMTWPNVARAYAEVFDSVVAPASYRTSSELVITA